MADARGRLSATRRGYGMPHKKLRLELDALVRSGLAVCWRCGEPIGPREDWDLGHDDLDRSRYRGPEHVRCNRSTRSRLRADPKPRRVGWA